MMEPGFFPISDPHGPTDQPLAGPRRIAGYDLDSNRILLPEHVRAMPGRERKRWMEERGIVPAIEGGAYSMFEMMQPFAVNDAPTTTLSATEQVLTQATILTLPANFFAFPGKCLWLHGMGKMSNVVTTPGTFTFRFKIGTGVTGDTLLAGGGAIVPDPVAVTDNLWFIDCWLKALTTGPLNTSLTLLAHGMVQYANSDASLASDKAKYLPAGGTSLANVANLDGTIVRTLTLTVQPSVATAGTVCTLRDVWVVAMN